MRLLPLGDRFLLRPLEVNERTPSGLFMPESAQPDFVEYEVAEIGDGPAEPTGGVELEVGDRVLLHRAVGARLTFGDQTFVVVQGNQILGLIVDEEEAERLRGDDDDDFSADYDANDE